MTEIRKAAAETPVLIMLIPDQFQVDDQLWQALGMQDRDRDQPQKRIIAWLQAEGIPYLDLLEVLRAVPVMADGQRHLYHLRDTHFNARGNSVTGKALAEFLRQNLR